MAEVHTPSIPEAALPSNLGSARKLEAYLRLAEHARCEPGLIPNHTLGGVLHWLRAHLQETRLVRAIVEKPDSAAFDHEFIARLTDNEQRVQIALTAYSS